MPKRPILVCFTTYKAYPIFNPDVKATFGGAEVDLYLLATELAKDKRFEVSFVVGDYGQPEKEFIENVALYKTVDVKGDFFTQTPKIWRALQKIDADIYFNEACSLNTFLHALFCKLKKKIFVYRTASQKETDGTYFRSKILRGIAVKWAFRHADQVLAQNECDIINLKINAGVSSIVFRNSCRIPKYINKNKDAVLWVGRSAKVKRPELFLELAREFTLQNFVMICPRGIDDSYYEDLVWYAESIKNLEFIKYCAFEKIDEYFQNAKIFVNTSDLEGFPNTFVQASKTATPILSLNVNPDNFLNNYNCGICCQGDMQKMKDSLKSMLGTNMAFEMGKNARLYAEAKHDIANIIENYKDLFIKLYNSKR